MKKFLFFLVPVVLVAGCAQDYMTPEPDFGGGGGNRRYA